MLAVVKHLLAVELKGCRSSCLDALGDRVDGVAPGRRSSSRTVNSSPPSRATVSPGRRHASRRARDGDQQLVADHVAEAVVDHLEAVEVEEQHGEQVLAGAGGRERRTRCASAVEEQGAVRQAVSASWNASWSELLLGALALR